jgi:hypothetical protein
MGDPPPLRITDVLNQIVGYLDLAYALGGTIFLGLALYLGFMYMISQGNPEKLQEIRQRVGYWVVGFLLFFLSAVIVTTMFRMFNVRQCGDPSKPHVVPGTTYLFEDCS